VAYDAFIFTLTLVGIVTVLVYSYKIAHSRVYPVGIVREISNPEKSVDLPPEQVEAAAAARVIAWREMWCCEHCGLVQPRGKEPYGKDFQCRRCKEVAVSPFATVGMMGKSLANESEQVAHEREFAEHAEALKHLTKMSSDFEKRIRKLEVEAVRQSQEAAEEKPQQAEYIH
jgi:hypothetical protein